MPPTTSKRKSTEPKSEGRGVQSIEIGARLLSALVEEDFEFTVEWSALVWIDSATCGKPAVK